MTSQRYLSMHIGTCLFRLFTFPTQENKKLKKDQMKWNILKNLQKKLIQISFGPQRNSFFLKFYFPHFADGRSSESIPYPLLHLGYYSESRVKQNVSSCHKPKYKDFVMETNNSTPEVLEILLARFEKTIPKSKVEGDFNCCIFQTNFLIQLTLTHSLVYSFIQYISRSFFKFKWQSYI